VTSAVGSWLRAPSSAFRQDMPGAERQLCARQQFGGGPGGRAVYEVPSVQCGLPSGPMT
jgi:hypothetical protein